MLKTIINTLTSATSEPTSGGTGASTEELTKIFTSPAFYIVIGAIVLLILIVYFFRRFVKGSPNAWKLIERRGKLHKVVGPKSKGYFMVPFEDSLVATVNQNEKEFSSDKLYINNGPDALYKLTYTMTYKVNDVKAFYPIINNLEKQFSDKVNDELRNFSDINGANLILVDFRENKDKIVQTLSDLFATNGMVVTGFKIKSIEPIGKK